jgi:hypothetical protein
LRQALERVQTGYFAQIFEGAEEDWGVGYFERRLKVGAIHDKANLPFKWYIGSYVEYQRLTSMHLMRSRSRPRSRLSSRFSITTCRPSINDTSNSIASEVEEQAATTNEIGRSVNEAAQGGQRYRQEHWRRGDGGEEYHQGANDTKAASLQLSEMAARLQAAVAKFTF